MYAGKYSLTDEEEFSLSVSEGTIQVIMWHDFPDCDVVWL